VCENNFLLNIKYMGSIIEFNDTLSITTEQGFPEEVLNMKKHEAGEIDIRNIENKIFEFKNKKGARLYQPAPTRCFLVHNIKGKWLYWGKIIMLEQCIKGDSQENQTTSGKYKIIQLYDLDYQEQATRNESPDDKSFL